jgi:hypothetical protein
VLRVEGVVTQNGVMEYWSIGVMGGGGAGKLEEEVTEGE